MNERLADVKRLQPAVAEGQPGQKIEGNRGKPEAVGQPGQDGKANNGSSQLHKNLRDIMRRRGHRTKRIANRGSSDRVIRSFKLTALQPPRANWDGDSIDHSRPPLFS